MAIAVQIDAIPRALCEPERAVRRCALLLHDPHVVRNARLQLKVSIPCRHRCTCGLLSQAIEPRAPREVNCSARPRVQRMPGSWYRSNCDAIPDVQMRALCAAQDLSSFYIVWATGHVTEASPDLPTTTNPYNVNPLNKSAPGAVSQLLRGSFCH